MRARRVLPWVLGVLLAMTPAFGASQPVAVSPGEPARVVRIGDGCPTFSWGESERAEAYELAIYRLGEEGEDPQPVLRQRIVGSALSWTPSLADCLEPGGRYVWFVRAVREGDGGEAGEWSDGRYFATPAGPTVEDVRRALAVLQAWSESAAAGEALPSASGEETAEGLPPVAQQPQQTAAAGLRAVPTAAAAMRVEQPDLSGETYGVVGISSSTDGAGMAAANLEGGPDLVLDGSADGVAGTELSEWGINRPAATAETFYFRNTGGGSLRVEVVGDLDAEALTVDEVHVPYGKVINDLGDWLGTGKTIPCTGCVTSSDLAAGAVTASDLATGAVDTVNLRDNAVTGPKIAPDAVTTTHIGDGAIDHRDLVAGAVRTAAILDGTIATADLADDAVTNAKIATGAVTGLKIATGAVRTGEILDGQVMTADLADGAITTVKLGDLAVTSAKIANGAITTAEIADSAVTTAKLATDAVTATKIANDAVGAANIIAGAVRTAEILDGQVTTADLADGAVTNAKIAPNSVTTTKIPDNAITGADIADSAIGSGEVIDGSLTAADMNPAGGVYASKAGVYLSTTTGITVPFGCESPTASCSDENDLPLGTSWNVGAGGPVPRESLLYWNDTASPAGFRISFCAETDQPVEYSISIACLSVPGP